MNGPITIYRLQPVFEIPKKLDIPCCMYLMKNPVACVATRTDHTDDEKEVLASIMDKVKHILKKPVPEMTKLEERWESVLENLAEIKSQIFEIKKEVIKACALFGGTIVDSRTLNNLKILQGTVINANPTNPPYSLLMIKHLYKACVPIELSTHVHSSISVLPDELKCFSQPLQNSNNVLKLNLIWKKDITDTELILNPVKQLPIKGEVNLLRFFARSGLDLLHYPCAELQETLQSDSVLDICHRLLHTKTGKEKISLLKSLNAKLGRSAYFGGDDINIGDVAAWSVIKQVNICGSQDLSQSMTKWFLKVNNIFNQ